MSSNQPADNSKSRVLVVDDESVICEILTEFLEFEGFDVRAAGSGEEAFGLLEYEPYDAVLTDLKMPGMDGLDLLRHLARLDRDTFAVIMTGFGTVESAIEAMKQGAFDYILKPFKPEEVVRVLRRGLEKQRLERENTVLKETLSFYELSEALSSAMPLDEQLQLIVETVRESFGADTASIVCQDRHDPCRHRRQAASGDNHVQVDPSAVLDRFSSGMPLLAHDREAKDWASADPAAALSVNSFMAAPLRSRGAPFGFLQASSFRNGHRFSEGQRKGLAVFGARAADAIETARMYGDLKETFTQTIEGFARAIEAKDPYTHGHSDRVASYSRMMAEVMGLAEPVADRLQHGGLMHDIGKIGIRSNDLNKPQKLTPPEYMMFKSHPVVGKRIIEPISFLAYLVPCVYYHHEAWDGSGYPEGLSGTDIPQDARLLAVADSYDAMTSNRPYRKALPHDIAVAELKRCSGRQFDPEVVVAFGKAIAQYRRKRREKGESVPE